ncbi:MAG TPA: very short patch repair endonuclease [Caulobacteraceae bacterium]
MRSIDCGGKIEALVDELHRVDIDRHAHAGVCRLADAKNPEPLSRSALMGRVRAKDTAPEMAVRRAAHALGFRFRLHRRDLPGTPDLIFPRLRIAMFVHGCFWHRHADCRRASTPKTRLEFWGPKFARNVDRDAENAELLSSLGWQVATIWECETLCVPVLHERLAHFLQGAAGNGRITDSTNPVRTG